MREITATCTGKLRRLHRLKMRCFWIASEMTLEEVLCEMESLVEDAGSRGCCGC